MKGITFNRLKMADLDRSYEYSEIGKAAFNSNYSAQVDPKRIKT